MTEYNPTSARAETPRGGRVSGIALLALAAGGVLILLNVMVLDYVINKERVFAERESEITAADLKVKQRNSQLEADLSTESRLHDHIADLQTQIGQKLADLNALKAKTADQQTITTKLDAMRTELNSDQDAVKKAVTEKATAERDRDAAESDAARLNEQAGTARTALRNLADQRETLSANVDQLNQREATFEQDTKKSEAKLTVLKDNLASASASLESLQAASKAAQAAAAAALADQQTAEKRRDAATQDAVHAEDLVKAAEQRRRTAEDDLGKLVQQEQTLKSSISTLTQQQAQASASTSSTQDQLKELTKQRDGQQQTLNALKGQIDLAQSQTAATSADKAQLDAAQAALMQKQGELAKVTAGLADAQKQLDDRQKQISDKNAAIGALETQAADLKRQIEDLRAERDQLVQETSGKEALDKMRQNLNAQIGDASTRLDQIKGALALAQAAQAAIEIKAGQRDTLDASIAEMSREKKTLSDDVVKLEARAASLRQSVNWLLVPQPFPLQFPGLQLNSPAQPPP